MDRQDDELRPADPSDVGQPERTPEAMQIEGAQILANETRDELRARGFSDDQIEDWAETYIAEEGSGDAESFLTWLKGRTPD